MGPLPETYRLIWSKEPRRRAGAAWWHIFTGVERELDARAMLPGLPPLCATARGHRELVRRGSLGGFGGIPLTPVAASGSSAGRRGLPAHAHGDGEAVRHRRGVRRVLGAASVGAGLLVPGVRHHEGLGNPTRLRMCATCGHQVSVTAGTI